MTEQSKNLIIDLLKLEKDSHIRELLFLKHQMTLPKNHRKLEDEDEDIHKVIYDMENTLNKVEQALHELETVVGLKQRPWQGLI